MWRTISTLQCLHIHATRNWPIYSLDGWNLSPPQHHLLSSFLWTWRHLFCSGMVNKPICNSQGYMTHEKLPPLNTFLQQQIITPPQNYVLGSFLRPWHALILLWCGKRTELQLSRAYWDIKSFKHSTNLAADNEVGAAGRPLHVHDSWWALQAQSGAGEEVRIAKRHSQVVVGLSRNGASCDCNTWRGDGACRRCGESCRHCCS